MKRNARRRGFTLVELIVVLVILAILAALLIPSLTGYIDKANKEKVVAEARNVLVAAQATVSEAYGKGQIFWDNENNEYKITEDNAHHLAEQVMDLAELPKDTDDGAKWKVYVQLNMNDEVINKTVKITKFYYYNGTHSIEYNAQETISTVEGEEITLPSGWSDAIRGEREPSADENGDPLLSSSDFTPDTSHDGPLY